MIFVKDEFDAWTLAGGSGKKLDFAAYWFLFRGIADDINFYKEYDKSIVEHIDEEDPASFPMMMLGDGNNNDDNESNVEYTALPDKHLSTFGQLPASEEDLPTPSRASSVSDTPTSLASTSAFGRGTTRFLDDIPMDRTRSGGMGRGSVTPTGTLSF